MKKVLFSSLALLLLNGFVAEAAPVKAKITVGNKTSDGYIVSRNDELLTFRQVGRSGDVSYPIDAVVEAEFPVEVDQSAVANMMQNRLHEQLAATLEAAMRPYEEYSDIPSNLSKYQAVLMELYYKVNDFAKCSSYSSKLLADDRDPELQRKAIVYQGLSLLGMDRLEEAESLFAEQGWTDELGEDASAEDLYITAKFQFMKKDYNKAMETVAKIIAFHSQDPDWMRPAELLCAETYMEMARDTGNKDYLDSASEVVRQITLLYKDTDEADQAQNLKLRIDALRLELE